MLSWKFIFKPAVNHCIDFKQCLVLLSLPVLLSSGSQLWHEGTAGSQLEPKGRVDGETCDIMSTQLNPAGPPRQVRICAWWITCDVNNPRSWFSLFSCLILFWSIFTCSDVRGDSGCQVFILPVRSHCEIKRSVFYHRSEPDWDSTFRTEGFMYCG